MIIHTLILENVMFVHVVLDHINPPSPPMTHIPLHNPLHTHSHPHPIPPNQSPSPNPLLPTHIPSHPHPIPSHPIPSQPIPAVANGGKPRGGGKGNPKTRNDLPAPLPLLLIFIWSGERERALRERSSCHFFPRTFFVHALLLGV